MRKTSFSPKHELGLEQAPVHLGAPEQLLQGRARHQHGHAIASQREPVERANAKRP